MWTRFNDLNFLFFNVILFILVSLDSFQYKYRSFMVWMSCYLDPFQYKYIIYIGSGSSENT